MTISRFNYSLPILKFHSYIYSSLLSHLPIFTFLSVSRYDYIRFTRWIVHIHLRWLRHVTYTLPFANFSALIILHCQPASMLKLLPTTHHTLLLNGQKYEFRNIAIGLMHYIDYWRAKLLPAGHASPVIPAKLLRRYYWLAYWLRVKWPTTHASAAAVYLLHGRAATMLPFLTILIYINMIDWHAL